MKVLVEYWYPEDPEKIQKHLNSTQNINKSFSAKQRHLA